MKRTFTILTLLCFLLTNIAGPAPVFAQAVLLPFPGMMVHLSNDFTPAILKGIVIHPENAFKFDFIVYKGDQQITESQKKQEYTKLIKYFLASLAVPDEDQWVNLSPYEHNRIIKDDFGKTEMGRDLLAQDYLLKQITASLIYPQDKLGRKFWDEVYERAYKQFGTTNIPVNTFNKVWIVPDEADIYEKGNIAYLYKSHLKVMLEEDYLSLSKHVSLRGAEGDAAISSTVIPAKAPPIAGPRPEAVAGIHDKNDINNLGSQIVRQIILPQLEKEVNEGKNFAPLRQVFSGMILAAWYKRALRESLLSKIYANKDKVKGVDQDPKNNKAIYQQYLKAYKKGVFNYIKEDVDKYTNEKIPRKYFSGGVTSFAMVTNFKGEVERDAAGLVKIPGLHRHTDRSAAMAAVGDLGQLAAGVDFATVTVDPQNRVDRAMNNVLEGILQFYGGEIQDLQRVLFFDSQVKLLQGDLFSVVLNARLNKERRIFNLLTLAHKNNLGQNIKVKIGTLLPELILRVQALEKNPTNGSLLKSLEGVEEKILKTLTQEENDFLDNAVPDNAMIIPEGWNKRLEDLDESLDQKNDFDLGIGMYAEADEDKNLIAGDVRDEIKKRISRQFWYRKLEVLRTLALKEDIKSIKEAEDIHMQASADLLEGAPYIEDITKMFWDGKKIVVKDLVLRGDPKSIELAKEIQRQAELNQVGATTEIAEELGDIIENFKTPEDIRLYPTVESARKLIKKDPPDLDLDLLLFFKIDPAGEIPMTHEELFDPKLDPETKLVMKLRPENPVAQGHERGSQPTRFNLGIMETVNSYTKHKPGIPVHGERSFSYFQAALEALKGLSQFKFSVMELLGTHPFINSGNGDDAYLLALADFSSKHPGSTEVIKRYIKNGPIITDALGIPPSGLTKAILILATFSPSNPTMGDVLERRQEILAKLGPGLDELVVDILTLATFAPQAKVQGVYNSFENMREKYIKDDPIQAAILTLAACIAQVNDNAIIYGLYIEIKALIGGLFYDERAAAILTIAQVVRVLKSKDAAMRALQLPAPANPNAAMTSVEGAIKVMDKIAFRFRPERDDDESFRESGMEMIAATLLGGVIAVDRVKEMALRVFNSSSSFYNYSRLLATAILGGEEHADEIKKLVGEIDYVFNNDDENPMDERFLGHMLIASAFLIRNKKSWGNVEAVVKEVKLIAGSVKGPKSDIYRGLKTIAVAALGGVQNIGKVEKIAARFRPAGKTEYHYEYAGLEILATAILGGDEKAIKDVKIIVNQISHGLEESGNGASSWYDAYKTVAAAIIKRGYTTARNRVKIDIDDFERSFSILSKIHPNKNLGETGPGLLEAVGLYVLDETARTMLATFLLISGKGIEGLKELGPIFDIAKGYTHKGTEIPINEIAQVILVMGAFSSGKGVRWFKEDFDPALDRMKDFQFDLKDDTAEAILVTAMLFSGKGDLALDDLYFLFEKTKVFTRMIKTDEGLKEVPIGETARAILAAGVLLSGNSVDQDEFDKLGRLWEKAAFAGTDTARALLVVAALLSGEGEQGLEKLKLIWDKTGGAYVNSRTRAVLTVLSTLVLPRPVMNKKIMPKQISNKIPKKILSSDDVRDRVIMVIKEQLRLLKIHGKEEDFVISIHEGNGGFVVAMKVADPKLSDKVLLSLSKNAKRLQKAFPGYNVHAIKYYKEAGFLTESVLIFKVTSKNQAMTSMQTSKVDAAMSTDLAMDSNKEKYGGIDMNAANLNWHIKRDGNGVPLPVGQQDLASIHIDGLVPVILKIVPVSASPVMAQLIAPITVGASG